MQHFQPTHKPKVTQQTYIACPRPFSLDLLLTTAYIHFPVETLSLYSLINSLLFCSFLGWFLFWAILKYMGVLKVKAFIHVTSHIILKFESTFF